MPLKVVIIGAVAAGPKTACRLKRLMPDAEVTMIDRDNLISYGGCGIPYFISGDVDQPAELQSTSFHMVRNEAFFKGAKGVGVLARTEVTAIDREAKVVHAKNLDTGRETALPYDKLVLATGSRPNRLPIPGADLPGVHTVSTLNEAIQIKEKIAAGKVGSAVVIGGGAIGLEMVEALADLWGLDTSLIEIQGQLLPGIVSPALSRMLISHLKEKEVENVFLSEKVLRIEGDGKAERVVTDKRTVETDMVIMAAGVSPNGDLAKSAGLEMTESGAIAVNSKLQTSDPDVYAGGDCVENTHLVTGKRFYMPSGSAANKHGRVIGANLTGKSDEFDGVVGSFILKCFDLTAAASGLSLSRARAEGLDAFSAFVVQGDRAHFYPEMDMMYMELVVERPTGRVLGVQGVASNGGSISSRINAIGVLLKHNPTVRDIGDLEIAYAPPYSAAVDIVNALGNTAENILAGKARVVEPDEFSEMFEMRENGNFVCLDVRGPENAAPFLEKYPDVWLNIPQETLADRLDDVPEGKELVLICNSGARSYEAQVTLDHEGKGPSRNLQGGIGALKKMGAKLTE